ncbi:unnamed protein product [Pleuronectes platessa]|uniref:Uncharacterized protein n=1 Tax=Pleuronectes platessa TaxID=8262 RepID=A0A9N7TKE1_PLEPL|nr:unnamed protein product [Pleuronectes platessa]
MAQQSRLGSLHPTHLFPTTNHHQGSDYTVGRRPATGVGGGPCVSIKQNQQSAGHQMIPLVGLTVGLSQTSIISTCSLPTPQRAPNRTATNAGAGRLDEGLISFPAAHQLVTAEA